MNKFLYFLATVILWILQKSSTFGHVHTHIDCSCPKFHESYKTEGSFSIDLYATLGPVDRIDYSNHCSDVRITCTSYSDTWDSDAWAVFNGTMTSMISATARICCDPKDATWKVENKKTGETQTWTDVSVYCQSYRAR
ncbi:hypothetical protein B9Z55_015943 [Caenorhabditis nigoni]|uniref:C6 domain-containing protein n=1 Tax=Caenorhabditis nigoni TaxID=1611254 RepID=A0A2G5UDC9_9PELO|nr:hypothetical protein B9Z55_015943 [Caenorhabditis nigoni]